ncbi:hypothetical protein D3C85_410080 [compost metagenome]
MVYAQIERVGCYRHNAQILGFLVAQANQVGQAALHIVFFDVEVVVVVILVFHVCNFVKAAEHKHRAWQQIQGSEQPLQVLLVAFLDGVGRVHHI